MGVGVPAETLTALRRVCATDIPCAQPVYGEAPEGFDSPPPLQVRGRLRVERMPVKHLVLVRVQAPQ